MLPAELHTLVRQVYPYFSDEVLHDLALKVFINTLIREHTALHEHYMSSSVIHTSVTHTSLCQGRES